MELPLSLNVEQEFNLRLYELELNNMNPEDAKGIVLDLMRQLMIKNNVIKHLIKDNCSMNFFGKLSDPSAPA
ncbi:MAG TPA: NblA/ycf18 family protein [Stenomitos sp.]